MSKVAIDKDFFCRNSTNSSSLQLAPAAASTTTLDIYRNPLLRYSNPLLVVTTTTISNSHDLFQKATPSRLDNTKTGEWQLSLFGFEFSPTTTTSVLPLQDIGLIPLPFFPLV